MNTSFFTIELVGIDRKPTSERIRLRRDANARAREAGFKGYTDTFTYYDNDAPGKVRAHKRATIHMNAVATATGLTLELVEGFFL